MGLRPRARASRARGAPLLIWSPWEPNLSRKRRRCQLGLLSINFVFRNVIFQPMVFPFVWANYEWKFMRGRCKLSFPLPLAANCNIRWILTINGMPMTLFFVVWTDFVITDRSILSFLNVGYSVLIFMLVCVTLSSQTSTQSNLY